MSAMQVFDRAAAERLAKVLGLLGSDQPGERAAAGYQAHRIITESGVTWPQIITVPVLEAPRAKAAEMSIIKMLKLDCWTAWERKFLIGVCYGNRPFSERQNTILRDLRLKAKAAGA